MQGNYIMGETLDSIRADAMKHRLINPARNAPPNQVPPEAAGTNPTTRRADLVGPLRVSGLEAEDRHDGYSSPEPDDFSAASSDDEVDPVKLMMCGCAEADRKGGSCTHVDECPDVLILSSKFALSKSAAHLIPEDAVRAPISPTSSGASRLVTACASPCSSSRMASTASSSCCAVHEEHEGYASTASASSSPSASLRDSKGGKSSSASSLGDTANALQLLGMDPGSEFGEASGSDHIVCKEAALAEYISLSLAGDEDLSERVPITADSFYDSLSDGVVLCKLVNHAGGDTDVVPPSKIHLDARCVASSFVFAPASPLPFLWRLLEYFRCSSIHALLDARRCRAMFVIMICESAPI